MLLGPTTRLFLGYRAPVEAVLVLVASNKLIYINATTCPCHGLYTILPIIITVIKFYIIGLKDLL